MPAGPLTLALEVKNMPKLPLDREPKLIDRIAADIAALGLVGEVEAGLLGYVMGTSRILNKPLAVLYHGQSSSGKSVVQRVPLRLFPDDTKIDATAITSASLFRAGPNELSHKILIGGERRHATDDNSADATAALRQLLSEGRISKMLCIKEGGDWVRKLIEVEGPVSYSESTTNKSTFAEDLNRMIQVTTDESEKQTRAVMKGVARVYSQDEADPKAIIRRHHEFQGKLEYCDVRIPYAEVLAEAMPAGKIEARRVIQQMLGTVEAVALLHQFRRGRERGTGRLVSTMDDYAVARRLLLGPLDRSLGFSNRARNAYEKLHNDKNLKGTERFSTPQATKAIGSTSRKVTLEAIGELEGLGVLRRAEKAKGPKPAWWAWTDKGLDELILPSPASVTALLRAEK